MKSERRRCGILVYHRISMPALRALGFLDDVLPRPYGSGYLMPRLRRSLSPFAAVLLLPVLGFPQEANLLETGHAAKLANHGRAPAQITVVTYNIRWRTGPELQQIADWLRAKQASLIALQEVDRAKERTHKTNNARALAEALGMYYAWAAPPLPKFGKETEEETG